MVLLVRDLNSLMLDQYRDETIEKQRLVDAKNAEIKCLAAKLASVAAERCALRNQRCQHALCEGEARADTGAAAFAKHQKRYRRNRRARRGGISLSCCAMHPRSGARP